MLHRSQYRHHYLFACVAALLLCLSSTFILLDAFVFASTEEALIPAASLTFTPVPTQPNATPVQKVFTDTEYTDENIQIKVSKVEESKLVYYVADIKLSSLQYFKTAFAKDKPGRNFDEETSSQAKRHNAIFAVSGDNYGARNNVGITIRNGALYRDKPAGAAFNPAGESLILMQDGVMRIVDKTVSGASLIEQGALHSWFFGPTLVMNGQYVERQSSVSIRNPRTGIGMIEPLHYIFIVVDGRLEDSKGLVMKDFAQLFVNYGCTVAYNLDGGGTSTMVMHDKIVNRPSKGEEREISDIIYIGLE